MRGQEVTCRKQFKRGRKFAPLLFVHQEEGLRLPPLTSFGNGSISAKNETAYSSSMSERGSIIKAAFVCNMLHGKLSSVVTVRLVVPSKKARVVWKVKLNEVGRGDI